MRTGRRWKKSIAQFGEEELTSSVKRIIREVFVCHHDRTMQGKSWTRQILSYSWKSTNWEDLLDNPLHTVMWPRNLQRLSVENSTLCLRILTLTDTWEVVCDTRCLFGREKRQNHERMNSESGSERYYGENLGRRSQDGNVQGQNR